MKEIESTWDDPITIEKCQLCKDDGNIVFCPSCGSSELDHWPPEFHGDHCVTKVRCDACKRKFRLIYVFHASETWMMPRR
jgi:hypothetical protein